MGMFNQDDSITDEFFTSDEEQVENDTAGSQDNDLLDEDNELETVDDNDVHNDDDSSTLEQDESELIAGKFKSQDDLINAYKNLEKEFTKSRQNKQSPPEQQQQQQSQQDTTDPNELFWSNFQQDPLGVLSYLVNQGVKQQTQPIYQEREDEILGKQIDNLAKDYKQIQSEEGLNSLFNKAQEIASSLGNEQLARNPKILKMAAIEAFGDAKADLYKKAKEAGKREAEQTRQTKQELSTIASSKKPTEKAKTPEDELADSILGAGIRKGVFGGS